MIKINLVPTATNSAHTAGFSPGGLGSIFSTGGRAGGSDEAAKEALKRLFLIFLGPISLFVYENQNIPDKMAELNSKSVALQELTAYNSKNANSVAEIKKFKEDEALIEDRISELKRISENRVQEIKIMDIIQSNIPEQVWLTSLNIQKDVVVIRGLSIAEAEVTSFQEALSQQKIIKDIKLLRSERLRKENLDLRQFEIECYIEASNE